MTQMILEPGSVLGVLGGGQLGAMFAGAARRMGYRVAVWDPDPDAPAHVVADRSFVSSFFDAQSFEAFSRFVHAITFEWENVPAELCERFEQCHPVRPSSAVLRTIQDRIAQKQFLVASALPVPAFVPLDSPTQLAEAVKQVGLPAVCKTVRSGYDGKGQWIIRQPAEVEMVVHALQQMESSCSKWILEQLVPFEREVSALVVRGHDGECRTYPAVYNLHEGGILRLTCVPSSLPPETEQTVASLARQAVEELNGIGVFCVEFFETSKGFLINEIAPRPHNSGHYTMDACTVSQFEQQVRVLCGMPLGEIRLLSPAAMVNLLGAEAQAVTTGQQYRELTSVPGAVLHLYGKRVVRPGRKMGHVTFLAERAEETVERATRLIRLLQPSEERFLHRSHLS
ncbi:MAG: 5-(carboxyamino)imidazole ribonucleotide synthase [Nitrospira sp.]|nr:5-(carboxyamino)imidazole ribonucleotide synthase [Nitrospira sp.]